MGFFEKLAEVAAKTKERLNEVATQAQDQLAKAATQLQEQLAEAGSQATGTTGSCSSGVHVVLESYAFENKVALMKLVARLKAIPLAKAKQLVEHAPAVVAISPSQMQALEVVSQIVALKGAASVHAGAKAARQHIEGIRDGNPRSTTHTRAAAPTATTAPGAMSGDRREATPERVEAHTTSESVPIGTQEQATTGTSCGSGEPIETGTIQWNSWRQSLACLIEDEALSSLCHRHLEGYNASQWMWNAKGAIWSDPLISLQDPKEQKGFFVKGRTYSHPLLEADAEPGCGTRGCKIGETYVKLAGILEQRKVSPAIQWEVLDTQVYVGYDTYWRHGSNGTVFIMWWFPLRQWSNYRNKRIEKWSGGVYEHAEEEFTWRSRVTPVQELRGHLLILSRIMRFKCTGCEVSWRVGHHVLVPPLA